MLLQCRENIKITFVDATGKDKNRAAAYLVQDFLNQNRMGKGTNGTQIKKYNILCICIIILWFVGQDLMIMTRNYNK